MFIGNEIIKNKLLRKFKQKKVFDVLFFGQAVPPALKAAALPNWSQTWRYYLMISQPALRATKY